MNEKILCEKCGAEMVPADPNKPTGMECPKCGWGWVTSYIDPKYEDETIYRVILDEGNKAGKDQLKAVSIILDCNFIAAKETINNPSKCLAEGRADEVDSVVQQLKEADMQFHVEPEYPY